MKDYTLIHYFVNFNVAIMLILRYILALLLISTVLQAQKNIVATRISTGSITLDGKPDEVVWQNATSYSDFLQKDPVEGAEPFEGCTVKVLYDDDNLYFAAIMPRRNPENILSTLSRRDEPGNAERIIFTLDTYNDKKTSYSYGVTADAVRFDYFHAEDEEYNRDYSYNPVWEVETQRDFGGWTAEVKIPFSQLRFNEADEQVWGININQWNPYQREDLYWVLVPKDEAGWASRFGVLSGIIGIKPTSRMEFLPYIVANTEYEPATNSNQTFWDELPPNIEAGLDFKMGIGPGFTLDATINPDFGQVEADPADVNLSAFETFFEEKRPFFIEGNNILSGSWPRYYYSRRIGGKSNGDMNGKSPDNTRILGAAKLTGRSSDGLSVGGLGAVTNNAFVEVTDITETKSEIEIEPMTYYGLARIQKEFGKDASTVGLMLTSVFRNMEENDITKFLAKNAFAGGADWDIRFDKGSYIINGHLGFSHLEGSSDAVTRLMQTSARYFQRPDASHLELDTNASSLTGATGSLKVSKKSGDWLWDVSVYTESPGLEFNDMGWLQRTDETNFNASLRYRETEASELLHSYFFNVRTLQGWNYGGEKINSEVQFNTNFAFLDRSQLDALISYEFSILSDRLTRGGPMMRHVWEWHFEASYYSSWAEDRQLGGGLAYETEEENGEEVTFWLEYTERLLGRFNLSIAPFYEYDNEPRQYIATLDNGRLETFGKRYVFSYIEQNTISTLIRLNYTFNPDLTLDLYFEPFAASGRYYDIGELRKPRELGLIYYGGEGTELSVNQGVYTVNADGQEYTLEVPDFNVLSFRSNVVLRWEWLPGSTLYLVWQQLRRENMRDSDPVGIRSLAETIDADGINYFSVKVSYWLPLK